MGDGVFSACTKLTDISIPDTLVYIGENVFASTPWRRAQKGDFLILGDGVLVEYTGNAAEIVIPDGVKRILNHRFAQLKTEPSSFTIPQSVEYIGKEAFVKVKASTDSSSSSFSQRYVTIIGVEGSYAQTYARDAYYTFKELK